MSTPTLCGGILNTLMNIRSDMVLIPIFRTPDQGLGIILGITDFFSFFVLILQKFKVRKICRNDNCIKLMTATLRV